MCMRATLVVENRGLVTTHWLLLNEVYVRTWYKTQDKVCKDELYAIEDTFLE